MVEFNKEKKKNQITNFLVYLFQFQNVLTNETCILIIKKNETCIFLLKKINFFIYHLFIQASEFISCYNLIFRIDVGCLSSDPLDFLRYSTNRFP